MKALDNKKVFVSTPDTSKAVQEKAFKLGYDLRIPKENFDKACFLFFSNGNTIVFSDSAWTFSGIPYEEITAAEILAMEVPEPEEKFYPFQKVLVRDRGDQEWLPNFFSRKVDGDYPYEILADVSYRHCIDYETNKHLAFTTDKP